MTNASDDNASDEGFYYGATADLTYAFAENFSGSLGVRASGIDDDLVGADFGDRPFDNLARLELGKLALRQ